jgi:hypothetical protein
MLKPRMASKGCFACRSGLLHPWHVTELKALEVLLKEAMLLGIVCGISVLVVKKQEIFGYCEGRFGGRWRMDHESGWCGGCARNNACTGIIQTSFRRLRE